MPKKYATEMSCSKSPAGGLREVYVRADLHALTVPLISSPVLFSIFFRKEVYYYLTSRLSHSKTTLQNPRICQRALYQQLRPRILQPTNPTSAMWGKMYTAKQLASTSKTGAESEIKVRCGTVGNLYIKKCARTLSSTSPTPFNQIVNIVRRSKRARARVVINLETKDENKAGR